MKTTIDLPPDLVREMKLRAVHEGRKLKDVAADLLRRSLAGESTAPPTKEPVRLPLFASSPGTKVRTSTAGLLALEQETLYQEDSRRLGLPL